jgi:hypothetical protein
MNVHFYQLCDTGLTENFAELVYNIPSSHCIENRQDTLQNKYIAALLHYGSRIMQTGAEEGK